MADFEPQNPADQSTDTAAPSSGSCCGGGACGGTGGSTGGNTGSRDDAFVADWSHAEKTLAAQADTFEARHGQGRAFEPNDAFWADLVRSQGATSRPDGTFWAELVRSQGVTPAAEQPTQLARRFEPRVGVQSAAFWEELVRSQQPTSGGASLDYRRVPSPTAYTLTSPPTGMGWGDDEASEWAPPERQERRYDAVQPAGEPVEVEASASRDDVEWGVPASAEQDWASARSEGLSYEPASDEKSPLRVAAGAAPAAAQPKAKKTRAAKAAAQKKPAAKKPLKAKKPAAAKAKKPVVKKAAAKKPAAKKLVKKAPPAPKITKAPTRRAA